MPTGKVWTRATGWKTAEVSDIKRPSEARAGRVCEDCAGTPHYEGSIDDMPMQETPLQLERIYGKRIAEEIELDDEMAHRWDY